MASRFPGLEGRNWMPRERAVAKTILLILVGGFIALMGFACAPPQPTPPPPTPLAAQVCDSNGALNPVPFLAEPFTPGPPYAHDPQPDSTPLSPEIQAIVADIQSDLRAAFNAAPPSFKAQLCGLNGIFLTRAGCSGYDPSTCNLLDNEVADNSWGFREPDGDKYIGISLGLWKNNACQGTQRVCAPPFQTYQTRLLRALLKREADSDTSSLPFQPQPDPNPPTFNVDPSTSAMSVLASLAHEYGHIYWWHNFVQPPGPATTNTSNTGTFCGGNFYPSASWQGSPVDIPPGRWISFGEIRLQPPGSYISQLPHLLRSGDYGNAGEVLHEIYSRGRWASALAAFSPDEDFVETFELSVLVNSGLQTLRVNVTGHGTHADDVFRNASSTSALRTKLQCFGPVPQPGRLR